MAEQKSAYRILRLIEYAGPLEWVNEQIDRRGVKGSKQVGPPGRPHGVIRECVLGEVATVLPDFDLPQPPTYAAGYESPQGVYAMFDGPTPELEKLLRWCVPSDDRRAHEAVILKLTNEDQTEIVCQWSVDDSEWKAYVPVEMRDAK